MQKNVQHLEICKIRIFYANAKKISSNLNANIFAETEVPKKLVKYIMRRAQRLINLEIAVLVRSLKSSNIELG